MTLECPKCGFKCILEESDWHPSCRSPVSLNFEPILVRDLWTSEQQSGRSCTSGQITCPTPGCPTVLKFNKEGQMK